MIPVCPIHQKPMRPSNKGGGFYCATKDPVTGEWCKNKAAGDAPAGNSFGVTVAPKAPDALPAAALMFAAHLCHGAGPEMADDAIAVAIKALAAMRAVV